MSTRRIPATITTTTSGSTTEPTRRPGAGRPTRRRLLLGAGTFAAALALGSNAALAAPPKLRLGDEGSAVTSLQQDLNGLKYWCGTPDGKFGPQTQQAVWALQKAAGLSPDGVVGPGTHGALADGVQPSREITSGVGFEISLDSQLLIATTGGDLAYIFNTSTGSGERYYSGGRWKTATTPTGDFSMYRLNGDGWESGPLGDLYRPGYYDRGWAVHGSNSVPTYPASHGCARLSVPATDMLWSRSWFVDGRRVLIY